MAKHNETGIKGEQIAEKFLANKDYTILHRNWCFEKKEVDLIAQKGDMLVFVEVKTRNRLDFGFPEEAVDARKQNHLKVAAEAFMDANKEYQKIQFDIVSVLIVKGQLKEILHVEDAFY
ncbi:YraN family protein [Polluticoccus soli]|uniref:YraN family protein n=1 Tax=Polluticoccus soli TaxID=3034150 RepID=UPI0023E31946|nr:YraN family protein [Flavipsychrobacter sp. JY13-12]